jgi:hypothetical protein
MKLYSPRISLPIFSCTARSALVSLFTFHFSLFTSVLTASAAPPAAVCPPYTFVGRITDSHHVAFDATNSATLRAYNAENKLIAVEKTFFRDDTIRNYALQIPMASSPAAGCAVTGDVVSVTATDPYGKLWSAVINPATIGTPGTVSEVDIVLAEDADGDGIDDDLYAELLAGWENSDFYDPSVDPYDPGADSDRDGVSDLAEIAMGTNPFNPADVLAIIDFDPTVPAFSFSPVGGRSYIVEQSSDLGTWTNVDFSTDASSPVPTRSMLSVPSSSSDPAPRTLYLFPTSSPAFFRILTR